VGQINDRLPDERPHVVACARKVMRRYEGLVTRTRVRRARCDGRRSRVPGENFHRCGAVSKKPGPGTGWPRRWSTCLTLDWLGAEATGLGTTGLMTGLQSQVVL